VGTKLVINTNTAILSLPIIFIHLETLWQRDLRRLAKDASTCVLVLCTGNTAPHGHLIAFGPQAPSRDYFPTWLTILGSLLSSAVAHPYFQCISLPFYAIYPTVACYPTRDKSASNSHSRSPTSPSTAPHTEREEKKNKKRMFLSVSNKSYALMLPILSH
jgi:hypothetical protein